MATFRATFSLVQNRGQGGSVQPVLSGSAGVGLAELTTSGTSQVVQATGGGDWTAPSDGYVRMKPEGGRVWVKIGTAPTAAVSQSWDVDDAERFEISISAGDKIAVIDDS